MEAQGRSWPGEGSGGLRGPSRADRPNQASTASLKVTTWKAQPRAPVRSRTDLQRSCSTLAVVAPRACLESPPHTPPCLTPPMNTFYKSRVSTGVHEFLFLHRFISFNRSFTRTNVTVSSGCRNEIPSSGRLEQQKCFFSQLWRLEGLRSERQHGGALFLACRQPPARGVLMRGGDGEERRREGGERTSVWCLFF